MSLGHQENSTWLMGNLCDQVMRNGAIVHKNHIYKLFYDIMSYITLLSLAPF